MQQVSCPGCGAPVQFKSAASVMAVCEFCKTTLLKDAGSVRDLGKMSEVLEDFSPLQIGTSGQFGGKSFSLIGRIQLRYSEGFWNEWYALFDDGSNGWVSDGSGQFTVTISKVVDGPLPLFEKLVPGHLARLGGVSFITADVRTAQCTGGQGELPFKVGPGYQARVADFRANDRFLTLDYSEPTTRLYLGQAVELGALKPQLLRDVTRIGDTSGRFHGKITALNCPACGAPVKTAPGVTVHIVCPSCHAEVDTSGATAEVLAKGAEVESVRFTLDLGDEATIDGNKYAILGAMRRGENGDASAAWNEYFLYSPGKKFIWLVETDEGWQRGEVLDRWPAWDGAGHAQLDGVDYAQTSQYSAQVLFAVGSFNWRVSVGDAVQVTEYSGGRLKLAAEATREELTWSRSGLIALDQVRAWFGHHVHVETHPHPPYKDTARRLIIATLLINAIPLLFATSNVWPYATLAVLAIYLPAHYLDKLDQDRA
jgi:Domain of unknown function (DUF4178)